MLRILVGTAAALMIALVLPVGGQQTPPAAVTSSYNDFMRLDATQRQARFGQLPAETKATFVRTHAEEWLASNRNRLDSSQTAVFQEAIASITPEIYSKPMDAAVLKKQQEVKANLRCRVSPTDVSAAFDVLGKRPADDASARWTYLSRAKCYIGWYAESVVNYLPAVSRTNR